VLSVTTDRTFSINAGLEASTVTPGKTAPEVSLTVPASEACAEALAAIEREHTTTTIGPMSLPIKPPLQADPERRDYRASDVVRILLQKRDAIRGI